MMRFKVYGRKIEVLRAGVEWMVLTIGQDGKRRVSEDIFIPSHLRESRVEIYLEDLLHEWATPRNNQILRID